ncbi:hypothetical protein ANN_15456 [Periplaneta americana]|uniref:Alpha-mannosidase n=1 Tax=Periplaneta americana TaxID=6978 RepID=A0ABQ8SGF1_PERAM|nr:hypothetical protein ANN_15456 [Periplaneta americana]
MEEITSEHYNNVTVGKYRTPSCPAVDPSKLNIHLVPHTHDDVGWLKTVDQYYYGSNTGIQRAGVQYILDSVIEALLKKPERRFIYVETAFFWKWWLEQDVEMQQTVKDLINQGRLEFIGGAWSMNDEAATHYHSTVDQFSWGLRKLNDTFGACGRPHIGWQIDPFGHSREMASLFAQMGYDGLMFGRLDYQDKENRINTKTLETMWQGSANLGAASDLFTTVLYNGYGAPPGFCFDVLCADTPFIDDKRSADYNVDQKVQDFVNYVREQASHYTSSNIILTMGSDFYYQDANMWYKNLDKLIKYVNAADSSLNVIYSTPSCYLKAVNDEGLTYTTKEDDFFPYASDPNSYWTGYFTSRPTVKRFERLGNNFLQVAKQLEAMTQLGQQGESALDSLREAMGVMQHHDAVTGTEKQHVAQDYARLLSSAMEEAREAAEVALNNLLSDGSTKVEVHNCLELNVSKCDVSENGGDRFVVTVYNPISHPVSHVVRFPVKSGTYTVQDPSGAEQLIQLVPIPDAVLKLPEREPSTATHDLVFRAVDLPSLGFRSYYVTRVSDAFEEVTPSADSSIGDANLQAAVGSDGKVTIITSDGVNVIQDFMYYEGFIGDNWGSDHRSSGAYIFRPKTSDKFEVSDSATAVVYKGEVVEEIHQTFSPWVSQIVRINKGENHVELEWLVGPIPIDDGNGKEVISTFSTNLATDGLFYTDSNGRELLERKRDFRPTWDVSIAEPAAGNYYPVTSKIVLRDAAKGQEVAVLNDRAQGGASLKDSEAELMVHRRLLHDDAFGVGEALNETAYAQGLVARGQHYVVAGATSGLAAQERQLAQRKLLSPWLFFSPGGTSLEEWQNTYKMEVGVLLYYMKILAMVLLKLLKIVPENIQILTLEPWKENTLLLRFEHIFEKNEDAELSQPATISYELIVFQDIFSTFSVTSSHQTTLAGNQWLEDMNRLVWKTGTAAERQRVSSEESRDVGLDPMQIVTYLVTVSKR